MDRLFFSRVKHFIFARAVRTWACMSHCNGHLFALQFYNVNNNIWNCCSNRKTLVQIRLLFKYFPRTTSKMKKMNNSLKFVCRSHIIEKYIDKCGVVWTTLPCNLLSHLYFINYVILGYFKLLFKFEHTLHLLFKYFSRSTFLRLVDCKFEQQFDDNFFIAFCCDARVWTE